MTDPTPATPFTGQDDWPCTCGHEKRQHHFGDRPAPDGSFGPWCQMDPRHCMRFRPVPDPPPATPDEAVAALRGDLYLRLLDHYGSPGHAMDVATQVAAALGPGWTLSRQQGDTVAGVYRERARLVAALARLYPASLERADPSPGFEWVVYVDLPTGQASWHVSDDDLDLFDGTPRGQGRKWDGHDDAEKHRRVDALGRGDAVAARVDEAMVGRVARALCDERGENWDWTVAHDPDFADALRTVAREALLGIGADGAGDGR